MIPNTYPGTNVLINKLNIRDAVELKETEQNIISSAMDELLEDSTLKINNKEDYFNLHKYMFEDLYDWAGKKREFTLEKREPKLYGASIPYAPTDTIDKRLDKIFNDANMLNKKRMKPTAFKKHVRDLTADIWRVHPFREGNTRTALVFANRYCNQHGYVMDISFIKDLGDEFRDALMFANCYQDGNKPLPEDEKFLTDIFNNSIKQQPHRQKKKTLE